MDGVDGVGRTEDGRRVYFLLPEATYGALAEKSLVRARQCIAVPDGLDDGTAAAIANPGMSAWVALMERAALRPGETVLVNGTTSTASLAFAAGLASLLTMRNRFPEVRRGSPVRAARQYYSYRSAIMGSTLVARRLAA